MSKVEEIAMEHCCAKCVHDKLGCSMKVLHNGRDCIKCGNYIKGYQQAEKDLALTEKDITNIKDIITDVTIEHLKTGKWSTTNTFNQEILNRFNKLKERQAMI